MNNEKEKNNAMSIFEIIGFTIFYILALPFVIVFGLIGVVFLGVYIIGVLIAWPFVEIYNAITARREEKKKKKDVVDATVAIPEKIEASIGTIEVNDNEQSN